MSKLKMKTAHINYIEQAIKRHLETHPEMVGKYESGDYARANRTKNLQRRFNNDLLQWAVGSIWVIDELYPYLNDTHIESALRTICPKVEDKSKPTPVVVRNLIDNREQTFDPATTPEYAVAYCYWEEREEFDWFLQSVQDDGAWWQAVTPFIKGKVSIAAGDWVTTTNS